MEIQVAVCGAGTMGSGIAQVSAQSGFLVNLFDVDREALGRAEDHITRNLQYLVNKSRITADEKLHALGRIRFTTDIRDCSAFIVIEAVAEVMDIKVNLFRQLAEHNNEEVIFATNTSSLSVSEMQEQIPFPQRVAGMHFFNPPYIMPLVEVVRGRKTAQPIIDALVAICEKMGKQPVICQDSPGFIVNRVARPYYLESLRLLEAGVASAEQIDQILEGSGFKMGPFRLMDMIGLDINLATSQSVYDALGRPSRLEPSKTQEEMVAKRELGRKTGKGFYDYN